MPSFTCSFLEIQDKTQPQQHIPLGHSNISTLQMFCTAWGLQTASASLLRKARQRGCPTLISQCVCTDSSKHQSYISSDLYQGVLVYQCRHSRFASKGATREGSNLPDQAQNIWKSETRQSLAMKQVPKEQNWPLLEHDKSKQMQMWNYLSLCPQITHEKIQSLLSLEKRETYKILVNGNHWKTNLLLGTADKSSVPPMFTIYFQIHS